VLETLCNLWNQQYRNITQIDNIRIGDDIHIRSFRGTDYETGGCKRERESNGKHILIYRGDNKRLKEVDDTEQYAYVYQVKNRRQVCGLGELG
jgi:hypothetical protein